jgi:hypothetical protein
VSDAFDPADPATWVNPHPTVELGAGDRALAKNLRTLYVALRQEQFTETQALVLLGTFLATVTRGNQ